MNKRFYVSPWFVLAAAAVVTAFAGAFNETAMVVYGLLALALLGRPSSKSRNSSSRNLQAHFKPQGTTPLITGTLCGHTPAVSATTDAYPKREAEFRARTA